MVLDYYKLREHPFGGTPDSRYLYMSATHKEALASLLYGLDAGCGFVALIAQPGLGKTTLLFHTLNFLRDKVTTVFLFQTVSTPVDLLRSVLAGLGVPETGGSLTEMQVRLKEVLVEQARQGKRVVVVIDEAQNLDDSVLELVRMLSNFETPREKLIQIILSGQPQLAEKFASPALVQLRQRISIFARLEPFSPEDIDGYIDHRLRTAGNDAGRPLFTKEARALIRQYSEGIPRNINNLCFNALSLGCALKRETIDGDVLREVVDDLDLERWRTKSSAGVRPGQLALQPAAEAPSFVAVSSSREGWLPRFAVAVAVMLVLCGTLFAGHRWLVLNGAVHATRKGVPLPATAGPSHRDPPTRTPAQTAVQADNVDSSLPAAAGSSNQAAPLAAPAEGAAQVGTVPAPNPTTPSSSSTAQEPQASASETTIRVAPGRTLLGICVESFGTCNPQLLQEIHRLNPRLSNPDHIESGQMIRLPASGATAAPDKVSVAGRDAQ
jgi:general secretion pathway protein A